MHWASMSSRWHADYERGRPGYPPSVTRVSGLPHSDTVLELGAGTGKLTCLLVAEFADVIAVEPDPEMRRLLVARCPRAQVLAGSAEQIPLVTSTGRDCWSAGRLCNTPLR